MRRVYRMTLSSGGIAILLLAAWLLLARPDPGQISSVSSLVLALIALGIASFGVYIAQLKAFGSRLRRAWGLIALAQLADAAANLLWAVGSETRSLNLFASTGGVLFLLTSVLMAAGILSLPYAPLKREQRRLSNVDWGILVLTGGVFVWRFIAADMIQPDASGVPGLALLAYPLADLLLVAGLIGMIQQDAQGVARRSLALLILGLGLMIGADLLFALTFAQETSLAAATVNLMWLAASWAVLAAAVVQAGQPEADDNAIARAVAPRLRGNALYGAVLASTGLALAALVGLSDTNLRALGTTAGALGVGLLLLLRHYFLLQDNRRLQAALAHQAITDELTGLANRRRCDVVLALEIGRAERYRRPLSVLLLDVDDFKAYNDRYGYLKGDMLLHILAGLLREQLRASDLAARYGGDEFVVILAETNANRASAVAYKLETAVTAAFGPESGVSVSIGYGAFEPGMTPDALLRAADQALHRARTQPVKA